MPSLPKRLVALAAAIGCSLSALPAAAQWIASGRWGTETNWRYVVPGTWLIQRSDDPAQPVSIHAEGDNHVGRIELWCNPETRGSALRFGAYRGDALHQPAAFEQEKTSETVAFVIDGTRFERLFEYDAAARIWTATDVLDADFLNAFSWASRMDLVNAAGEPITGYRMNGSSAAREALRRSCQF
ncbi:MAG: hypothetical protein KDK01_04395 [Rhodobacteraceae bacterium]|jgi:hypothetical protein|nr:hypothetical protein [Paracoccaceae bacterium]